MSQLSVELWLEVFEHLHYDAPIELKSLVQVCRGFRTLGVPLLFSELRITSGDAKYNFLRISVTPSLAQHVKKIEFCGPGATPHFHQIDTKDLDYSRSLAYPLFYGAKPVHGKADIMRSLTSVPGERSLKRRTLFWQHDHLTNLVYFVLKNGLGLDLSVFPRLQTVETDTAIFLQGEEFRHVVAELRERLGTPRLDHWRVGAETTGATVVSLSLYRIQEILGASTPANPLATVKHVKIDISDSTWTDTAEWKRFERNPTMVLPWLWYTPSFKTLTLIQNPSLRPAIDVVYDWDFLKYSFLRKVEFVHVTTTAHKILDFVDRHGGPLQDVRIHEPLLPETVWDKVRCQLEAKAWSFENLELSGAYKPKNMSRLEWDRHWMDTRLVASPL